MNIKQYIVNNEGLRLKPYRCTAGKLTIGIGRNLEDVGISGEEADLLFENDLAHCEAGLSRNLPWFSWLDEVRKAVLIDMCFNLGIKGLLGFKTTLSLIEAKKYTEAAEQMLKSKWAHQVPKRAQRNSRMMTTGQWQT